MVRDICFLLPTEEEKYLFTNTYDGSIVHSSYLDKVMRKNNIRIIRHQIQDNTFHKYDVNVSEDTVFLNVYTGHFKNGMTEWGKSYTASACISRPGIKEEGDCDLAFWHEYFATYFGGKPYDERLVSLYETEDYMVKVRQIFKMELQENPFLFFEKYKNLKKYSQKDFDKSIFDIPECKTPLAVGKAHNGKVINYVCQHEIELSGEVFFDLSVITGPVKDGMIEPQGKHRIFLTDKYWYSPDGGDIGVLVERNTFGVIYSQKMNKKYSGLMLDRYNGKYKYQYILSKGFIPCFELLAKAGHTKIADAMLSSYYAYRESTSDYASEWNSINIYGRNDKEIFGFRMSKFSNLQEDFFDYYYRRYGASSINGDTYYFDGVFLGVLFPRFINDIKTIIRKNEAVLSWYKKIDANFFEFLLHSPDISERTIDYIWERGGGAWRTYNDYCAMCRNAGLWSGGVYPKSLKHEHDVMVAYTNQMKEIQRNTSFTERVSSKPYQELIYGGDENDSYCILAPRDPQDLADEGVRLHHCVKSYVQRVSQGSTAIYFLREKERKAASLVTLEVYGRWVRQARGKFNRATTPEEDDFIRKWACIKGLTVNY